MDAVLDKRARPQPNRPASRRQRKAEDTVGSGVGLEVLDHSDMIRQILAILKRRKKFILTMTAIAGVLAAVVAVTTTRTYLAQALLVVEIHGVEPGTGRDSGATSFVPQAVQEAALDTHITSLLSEANLRRALDKLPELAQERRADTSKETHGPIQWMVDKAIALRTATGRLIRYLLHGAPSGAARSADVVRLTRSLKIVQERRSNVISVGYWSPDPVESAKVANTIAQVYVDELTAQIRRDAERELTWLTGRIGQVQKDLAEADTKVELFRQVHAPSDGTGPDEIEQQIIQTARQLSLYKTNAANSQARLDRFSARRKAGADAKELAEIAGSRRLAELARREAALAGSAAQEDQAELADTRRAAEKEADVAEADIRAEVRSADSQVSQNEDKLQLLQKAAHQSIGSQAQLRLLERKAAALSQLYDGLLHRKEVFTEHAQTPTPEIRILAQAWPPNRPASISPFFIIPPAMIAFGLLGCFIAVARDRLANALHHEAETEMALQVPCAGVVPELHNRNSKVIESLLVESSHSRYLKTIRSVLAATMLRERDGTGPKLILVTSAQAAEGKSTFARSAAIVAAQLPRRVLLIGFDGKSSLPSRKPAGPRDVRAAATREEFLARTRPILPAVEQISSQGFDYLSIRRDDLFRLLTTDQLPQAIGKFRENYDFIIVNAPPVLEGPETTLLAGFADEVLFLVRWGQTNRAVARRAIERVQAAISVIGSTQLFAVLTRVPLQDGEGERLETG